MLPHPRCHHRQHKILTVACLVSTQVSISGSRCHRVTFLIIGPRARACCVYRQQFRCLVSQYPAACDRHQCLILLCQILVKLKIAHHLHHLPYEFRKQYVWLHASDTRVSPEYRRWIAEEVVNYISPIPTTVSNLHMLSLSPRHSIHNARGTWWRKRVVPTRGINVGTVNDCTLGVC